MFEQLIIDGDIIYGLMTIAVVLPGLRLVFGILAPHTSFEGLSYISRAAIYGMLTAVFYYYTKENGFEKMSIINAFALVFCCLETLESLASFIIIIVKGIRGI